MQYVTEKYLSFNNLLDENNDQPTTHLKINTRGQNVIILTLSGMVIFLAFFTSNFFLRKMSGGSCLHSVHEFLGFNASTNSLPPPTQNE